MTVTNIGYRQLGRKRLNHSINIKQRSVLNRKVSGAIAIYATFFSYSNKKPTTQLETVYNSEWDTSVQQVVDYLKNKIHKLECCWSFIFQ